MSDPFSDLHSMMLDMKNESVRMLREQPHIILSAIQHCTLSIAFPTSSECESGMFHNSTVQFGPSVLQIKWRLTLICFSAQSIRDSTSVSAPRPWMYVIFTVLGTYSDRLTL